MDEQVDVQKRTQKERKAATIDKLVKATVSAIADLGYQKASISAICERAGVSQGALFRHFSSRKVLVIEVAEHVCAQIALDTMERIESRKAGEDFLAVGAEAICDAMHSPGQAVYRELKVAARTEPELCLAIADLEVRMNQKIRFMVETLTLGLNIEVKVLVSAVYLAIRCFDGLAMTSCLHKSDFERNATRQFLVTAVSKEFGVGLVAA